MAASWEVRRPQVLESSSTVLLPAEVSVTGMAGARGSEVVGT
mgnify:FL=1